MDSRLAQSDSRAQSCGPPPRHPKPLSSAHLLSLERTDCLAPALRGADYILTPTPYVLPNFHFTSTLPSLSAPAPRSSCRAGEGRHPSLYQPTAPTTSEIAISAVGRATGPARYVPGLVSQGVAPPIHWRVGLPSTVSSGCVEQAWSGAKGGWRKRAAEHLHGCGNIGCCGGSGSGGQGEISRTGKWAGRAGNGG